jgi:hypothetical protein
MSKALSVAQMLDHLEARIAHLRERRAFHAEQEAHHREQLALHDAELQKVLERFEAFKTAAEAAAEVALPPSPAVAPAEEPIPSFGSRPRVSSLVARVVDSQPAGEPFGARSIAEEVNRRYQEVLKKPVRSGTVSVALRRLLAARRLQQIRPGRALHEALYSRV